MATLRQYDVTVVELSALRVQELEPLASAIPDLDLAGFSFVSLHAPSRFDIEQEESVVQRLVSVAAQGLPVIVHPDVIYSSDKWTALGNNLLIENMDKRKPVGRTAHELQEFFTALPAATLLLRYRPRSAAYRGKRRHTGAPAFRQ